MLRVSDHRCQCKFYLLVDLSKNSRCSSSAPSTFRQFCLSTPDLTRPYVETIDAPPNRSIVLYPDNLRGPVSIAKAQETQMGRP